MDIQALSPSASRAAIGVSRIASVLNLLRHRLRRLSWMALLAIFGLAMAPTISRALAHADPGRGWTEVCTPQGMKLVALDDRIGEEPTPGATMPDHCSLCAWGGAPMAPPSPPVALPGPDRRAVALPTLFLAAPRPLFAWAASQPRAPPTLS